MAGWTSYAPDPSWNKAPGWWLHAFYSGIRALLLDAAAMCGYCPRAVLMYFAVNKEKDPAEQTNPPYLKNWALTQDRLDVPPTVFPSTDAGKKDPETYPTVDEDMTPEGALQRFAAGVQGTDWAKDRDVVKAATFFQVQAGQSLATTWKAIGDKGCVAKWRAHFTAKPLPGIK